MKHFLHALRLGLAALPLSALPCAQQPHGFEPACRDGRVRPELHGVWRTRGYGWVAELRPEGMRVFDHGPAGTLSQESDPDELLEGTWFRLRDGTLQLTGTPGSTGIYTWDRLEALPAACATPPGTDPVSVFDYFWGVMQAHYAYFDLRGVDWEARRERHRPRVTAETGEAELWEILCDMLRGLRDDHLGLRGTVDGVERSFDDAHCRELDPALAAAFAAQDVYEDPKAFRRRWFRTYAQGIRETLLEGDYQEGAGRGVVWGRMGPIGYVNVRSMGGFAPDDDQEDEAAGVHALMGRVLSDLADCDGLVLDITLNTGGYEVVQMALSSHFTDRRRPAFSKRPLDTELPVEPQTFHLFPADGPRFLKPVSLVTSDYTVSAGEDFTLAMRQLPHVTHRGARTRGAFSDILTKTLPNGWSLDLSNEAYYDVNGNNWEARGVPPEEPVPIFVEGNLDESHVEAIYAIVDAMIAEEG